MQFTVEPVDIASRSPTVLLNESDAAELGVHPLDRVHLDHEGGTTVGIVELTDQLVPPGVVGTTRRLDAVTGPVDVSLAPTPASVRYIRKKLDDIELESREFERIVHDITEERLADVELGAYVAGVYANGLSLQETLHLTEQMTAVGEVITWDRDVVADKHSIGGVPGNRVTPVLVPLVASAGLTIPKTSSRAVTSAAGTADTMEVFCDVSFTRAEVERLVDEVGACIVWGGAVNLSPVDDKIIRAETPLSLDPPGQLIASVLSKKKSAGSTHVVVDIPYGEGAKMESLARAREFATDIRRVGEHIGLTLECAITLGSQPIGRGVGPTLEARDVLETLDGAGPADLRLKSIRLADVLFECCDVDADATELLDSGAALDRFRRIVAAQGGDPDVSPGDLSAGRHTRVVHADRSGIVTHVDNRLVNDVARRAGAPRDHGAGVDLHCRAGDTVEAGEPLCTVHADVDAKLDDASSLIDRSEMIRVRGARETLVERV
ncbi:AMP phosphorylase [Salinigranum halophilum]|jgi:AMP phosphorylase|uniref:AMP phosphorylase n=1 Tax=Salinigranum halophilum TaxID=2565931 RepID=UPI0010A75E5E|nr:AMP phosphorylase [Salinigranum halophilum]